MMLIQVPVRYSFSSPSPISRTSKLNLALKGIGRSAAILFAKEGAKVVVSDIDAKKGEDVVNEIKAFGGDAISVSGDVGADDFPKKIVDATVQKYGKINHIVNNGMFSSSLKTPQKDH
ncbi:hypothetical protein E1B28_009616 [Marasmius oreades]|uniref:Uncharacterized protein n=1 Tax=Marasmius oreades TaxID=181124 RepID=A0A9P7RW27_9AGAR|nr:uncharacterized protein E1B28_009616 [Marasmius oreades]KAG7090503.1 hypothetical protein E1B28_009616 [Marasmius oreades]